MHRKIRKRKSAQMEIMGLAIIVLLITLGFLLYLRFSKSSDQPEIKQDFMDTKLASNLLTVILKTTDENLDMELKNLFQACAEDIKTIDYGGTNDPCEKVNSIVESILDDTLKQWKKNYVLTAKVAGKQKTHITNGDCRGDQQSETFLLPTAKGPMLITLNICR
jgi:hypothetical protein